MRVIKLNNSRKILNLLSLKGLSSVENPKTQITSKKFTHVALNVTVRHFVGPEIAINSKTASNDSPKINGNPEFKRRVTAN